MHLEVLSSGSGPGPGCWVLDGSGPGLIVVSKGRPRIRPARSYPLLPALALARMTFFRPFWGHVGSHFGCPGTSPGHPFWEPFWVPSGDFWARSKSGANTVNMQSKLAGDIQKTLPQGTLLIIFLDMIFNVCFNALLDNVWCGFRPPVWMQFGGLKLLFWVPV